MRAVESVKKQTFTDYNLILVDDCSTDKTRQIIREQVREADVIMLSEKRFNGGSRNVGVAEAPEAQYLLFLDADDEFIDADIFQRIHDFIVDTDYPEMVRLPYLKHFDETGKERAYSVNEPDGTIAEVCHSKRVAPWTKALKMGVFVPFPENTLFEDVCQHIKQCDVVNSVAFFPDPVVKWHIHSASTSHNNSPKWQSSAYRFVADLMDMELVNDYAKARRDKKLAGGKKGLLDGIAIQ